MGVKARISSSNTYTMRELNQRTADVIKEINEAGEPAVITRRGRFVALITPLANVRVETATVRAAVEASELSGVIDGSHTAEDMRSVGDAADELDVHLR